MFSATHQTLVMGFSFVAFYILNFLLILRYAGQRRNRSWKPSYTITGILLMLLLTLQPVLLPWLGLYSDALWARWVQFVGIALVVCSLLLQLWARLHLGRFYAERAEVQPGHQLISSGPYAHMRHPLFTSYFMLVTGLLLVSPNLLMLLGLLYTYWDFSKAAVRDEKVMAENVPGYREYILNVPRFFPRFASRNQ